MFYQACAAPGRQGIHCAEKQLQYIIVNIIIPPFSHLLLQSTSISKPFSDYLDSLARRLCNAIIE